MELTKGEDCAFQRRLQAVLSLTWRDIGRQGPPQWEQVQAQEALIAAHRVGLAPIVPPMLAVLVHDCLVRAGRWAWLRIQHVTRAMDARQQTSGLSMREFLQQAEEVDEAAWRCWTMRVGATPQHGRCEGCFNFTLTRMHYTAYKTTMPVVVQGAVVNDEASNDGHPPIEVGKCKAAQVTFDWMGMGPTDTKVQVGNMAHAAAHDTVTEVRCDRQSWLGNPFHKGRGSSDWASRNTVCEAHAQMLDTIIRDGSQVNVDELHNSMDWRLIGTSRTWTGQKSKLNLNSWHTEWQQGSG